MKTIPSNRKHASTPTRTARSGRLQPSRRRNAPVLPPVERYTDKRIAEFLLSNTVDAADYARACDEVRKLGLDPAKIRHYKPPGVA